MDIVCNKCGNREREPYDVGDTCYFSCGGVFVERKPIVEKDPNGKEQHEAVYSTQDLIRIKCDEYKDLLLEKNREYGDSALHPLGIFSKLDAIEAIKIRIDDKLARIRYGGRKNIKEDTVLDLIGYLVLMRVCEATNNSNKEG